MRQLPKSSASPSSFSARSRLLYSPPWQMMPTPVSASREQFVQPVFADVLARRGQAHAHFQLLLPESGGRMHEVVVVEHSRVGLQIARRDRGRAVGAGDEAAVHVAGADAQIHDHRGVGRLRQLEAPFHQIGDGGEVRPRVEHPHRGLHRHRVGALLRHARALAVILADHDQRAAEHARAGQMGQGVGGDVGADDRLPGHGAARRIVDRGAEHGRRRGFVGAGLDVHAQFVHVVARLHHDVEQVRHRRALVAADIGHARLQQRLGHGEYAFAVEGFAGAEFERLDFCVELSFHSRLPCAWRPAGA